MTQPTAVSPPDSSANRLHPLQSWLAELRDVEWSWVVFHGIAVGFVKIIVNGVNSK